MFSPGRRLRVSAGNSAPRCDRRLAVCILSSRRRFRGLINRRSPRAGSRRSKKRCFNLLHASQKPYTPNTCWPPRTDLDLSRWSLACTASKERKRGFVASLLCFRSDRRYLRGHAVMPARGSRISKAPFPNPSRASETIYRASGR